MMKRISLIIAFALISGVLHAQQESFGFHNDALRFSLNDVLKGSSARIQGIGGAQVALGGDVSSINSNPAGLGFFNRGTFVVTPSIGFTNTSSTYQIQAADYLELPQESFNTNFNFANLAMVFHFPASKYGAGDWKGSALGISMNRRATYHQVSGYEGFNDFNSLADGVALGAGTINPNDLYNDFALGDAFYNQYLISPEVDESGNILGYFADFDGFPAQQESIKETGSHYQLNVSWGGNYDDFLYFGGGMGVQILNYRSSRDYIESEFGFFDGNNNFIEDQRLRSINLIDDVEIRGSGVNFNFGVIARPLNFWTIGASYNSPSFFAVDDQRFFDLDANWKEGAQFISDVDSIAISSIDPYQSDLFISSYSLRTPSRISLGTALFLGKVGFISADIEQVNYGNALLRSEDFNENADNAVIQNTFSSVMNVRLGAELRFGSMRFRSGYAYYPSPFEGSSLEDQEAITFGLGYRDRDFFVDLSFVNRQMETLYRPYDSFSDFQPEVATEINNTTASLTFGLNF